MKTTNRRVKKDNRNDVKNSLSGLKKKKRKKKRKKEGKEAKRK